MAFLFLSFKNRSEPKTKGETPQMRVFTARTFANATSAGELWYNVRHETVAQLQDQPVLSLGVPLCLMNSSLIADGDLPRSSAI